MVSDSKIIMHIVVDDNGVITQLKATQKGFEDIDLTTKNAKKSAEELNKAIGRISASGNITSIKLTEKEYQKLLKTQDQLKTATGGASSAAMELGRVISDSPYGIRGMANNITQLVSQLGYQAAATNVATGAAYGYSGALKAMWTAMMGPLGIVLAITTLVSALDWIYGANKKAEKSNNDYLSGIEDLVGVQSDLNDKTEEYLVLQKIKQDLDTNKEKSNKRLKELDEEILEVEKRKGIANSLRIANEEAYATSLDKTTVRAKGYYKGISKYSKEVNELTTKENELNKERLDITNTYLKQLEDYRNKKKSLTAAEEGSLKALKLLKKEREEEREVLSKTSTKYKELTKDIDDLQNEIEAIEGKKDKAKFSPFKTGKELEIDIKSNESAIIDFNKKIEEYKLKRDRDEKLRTAKTAQEKNNIKFEYDKKLENIRIASELDSLKLKKTTEEDVVKGKYETFKIEAELRLKSYNDSIDKNDKISKAVKESLKEKAGLDTAELIKDAGGEQTKSMDEIKEKYKPLFELFELLKKARLAAFVSPPEEQVKEFDKIKHYIGVYKETMSGLTDFISGEYERQLTMEQNKTNSLNEELNNRLLNEKLSKNERESIQKQIWQNDENLRKNQEIIARKKFNTEKAFNISMAIIDTYGGATKALNDKTVPSTIARFALAAATIASGMFQVAKISSQQFQSSSAATPIRGAGIGGSGGQGDRSFNYNLVGNTQANQIAEAIQNQFSSPLKAYVVSRDVTTQQELDMNIKSGASF